MAKNKQQNGFTLIEAVVTTAIVALMSALVVAGTNGARERFQVRNAAQQFASDLRETILMTKNGVNATDCVSSVPPVPRECSSYQIVVSADGNSYTREVVVGATYYRSVPFVLPGGTKLSPIDTTSFDFLHFPLVTTGGTLNYTVESKNDYSIKTYVCVTPGGVVSVKTSSCL